MNIQELAYRENLDGDDLFSVSRKGAARMLLKQSHGSWSYPCLKCRARFDDAKVWQQHQVMKHGRELVHHCGRLDDD